MTATRGVKGIQAAPRVLRERAYVLACELLAKKLKEDRA